MGNLVSYRKELKTVDSVDLNRYLGTWYEVARKPNWFEDPNATNITANYSLNNGNIVVRNEQFVNGTSNIAIGTAYSEDSTNSKLKVSFFWPFYGDYRIIILDSEYKYSVVTDAYGDYLWILSRTKTLENLQDIIQQVQKLGVSMNNIIYCAQ